MAVKYPRRLAGDRVSSWPFAELDYAHPKPVASLNQC